MASKFQCSQETQDRIAAFEAADLAFKQAMEQFDREHEIQLAQIEKLRDDRNAKLDEARRILRQETEGIDEMRATFNVGPFKVQKKWSDYYIPEKTVAMLTERGLYDAAVSAKVVAVRVEVAKYDQMKKFLEDNGVMKDFECCEDGEEASTAISGPKQVPPLGAELKKE